MSDLHERVQGSLVRPTCGPLLGREGLVQGTCGELLHVLFMLPFPVMVWMRLTDLEGPDLPNAIVDAASEIVGRTWVAKEAPQ